MKYVCEAYNSPFDDTGSGRMAQSSGRVLRVTFKIEMYCNLKDKKARPRHRSKDSEMVV